jgi:histidine triad (HIT) family protein
MVSESDCLFCKIIRGEIPAKKVYEDKSTLAFLDINPRNPGHTLVVPKKHTETLMEMGDKEAGILFQSVLKAAKMVANGAQAEGISIGQSNGKAAGQVIAHVHFHVIPRYLNEGPPGLESILPAKRLDDASMDKIAEAIKGASAGAPKAEKSEEKPKKDEEISFEF